MLVWLYSRSGGFLGHAVLPHLDDLKRLRRLGCVIVVTSHAEWSMNE